MKMRESPKRNRRILAMLFAILLIGVASITIASITLAAYEPSTLVTKTSGDPIVITVPSER